MSALDQAFIKAYSQHATNTSAKPAASRPSPEAMASSDAPAHDSYGTNFSAGYRIDAAQEGNAMQPPHARFARTGNTLRSRYTAPPANEPWTPPAPEPQPVQEYPELLPQPARKKPLGLSQLAQQLVGDLPAPIIEEDYSEPLQAAEPKVVPAAAEVKVVAQEAPAEDAVPAEVQIPNTHLLLNINDTIGLILPQVMIESVETNTLHENVITNLSAAEALANVVDTYVEVTPDTAPPRQKQYRRFDSAISSRGPHFAAKPTEEDAAEDVAAVPELDDVAAAETSADLANSAAVDSTDAELEQVAVESAEKAAAEPAVAEEPAEQPAAEQTVVSPPVEKQPVAELPVVAPPKAAWEVDVLEWPEVVDKLTSQSDSYFSQAGKKLTDAVRDGLRTLGVAASQRGEGCTTVALSLARTAAQCGLDVAIIDANFARPQVAENLQVEIPHGWELATAQEVDLAEVAIHAVKDRLMIYSLQTSSGLSLANPKVFPVLAAIAARHALTIIDLGPVPAGDARLIPTGSSLALDAVVLVRDVIRTPLAHVRQVASRVQSSGIDAVAIAENFVS